MIMLARGRVRLHGAWKIPARAKIQNQVSGGAPSAKVVTPTVGIVYTSVVADA